MPAPAPCASTKRTARTRRERAGPETLMALPAAIVTDFKSGDTTHRLRSVGPGVPWLIRQQSGSPTTAQQRRGAIWGSLSRVKGVPGAGIATSCFDPLLKILSAFGPHPPRSHSSSCFLISLRRSFVFFRTQFTQAWVFVSRSRAVLCKSRRLAWRWCQPLPTQAASNNPSEGGADLERHLVLRRLSRKRRGLRPGHLGGSPGRSRTHS